MSFEYFDQHPVDWKDHEDIAILLHEKFGNEFTESQIYRVRFTELIEWILSFPQFVGNRENCTEGHLEQIQAQWVYEWRSNK